MEDGQPAGEDTQAIAAVDVPAGAAHTEVIVDDGGRCTPSKSALVSVRGTSAN
ncbi:hypothetical protein ACFP2T_35355 [Plantactinospora solaniradicis]|uniref:Uncharacterized protein n=1 Tax=Plantactinospora solaniradicis TaxID=1723736 RepID=A0ABW1KKN8_9ACTN